MKTICQNMDLRPTSSPGLSDFNLLKLFTYTRWTALITVLMLALPLRAEEGLPEESTPSMRQLEIKTWTSSESQFPAIERQITQAIQINPRSPYAHYLMAHLMIRQFTNKPSELALLRKASEMGQQAIELSGKSELGYLTIAEILDIMGQTDNGLKILESLSATTASTSWRYHFTRARLMAERSTNADVIATLMQALATPDAIQEIVAPYLLTYMQNEYTGEKLIAELTKVNQQYPSPLFLESIALTLVELKKYDKAHLVYRAIANQFPQNVEARINGSILLYEKLLKPAQAKEQLRALAENKDIPLNNEHASIVHEHLGIIALNHRDMKEAESHFIQAFENSNQSLEFLDSISRAYRKNQKASDLVKLIDIIQERAPGIALHHALKGEVLSEDLRSHKSALKAFSNAIILEPDRSEFYNGMGLAYYRMSDLSNALQMFMVAVKVDPQDATARYNEACVLARLGQPTKALGALKDAIELDPRLQETAQNDGDFASIRATVQFEELMAGTAAPKNTVVETGDIEEVTGH